MQTNVIPPTSDSNSAGFTLIELSIVLVIIGLIVGGVIFGKDLINSAKIRSQVSQIERYQSAVNTFKLKYGYLPGDISDPTASAFGFIARGIHPGQGDGNAIIEGNYANNTATNWGLIIMGGETAVFWRDLTTAKLLDGGSNTRSSILCTPGCTGVFTGNFGDYFPAASIGNGNYIHVYSTTKQNYFGLSIPTSLLGNSQITASTGLTVSQAYSIDNKLDNGLPQTGRITANYVNTNAVGWSANAAAASATTCFDTTSGNYSVGQNSGDGVNCALSFKFQ